MQIGEGLGGLLKKRGGIEVFAFSFLCLLCLHIRNGCIRLGSRNNELHLLGKGMKGGRKFAHH